MALAAANWLGTRANLGRVSSARPGWYPDPARAGGGYRWWDGSTWTEAVGEHSNGASPSSSSGTPGRKLGLGAAMLSVGVALVTVVGVLLGLAVWRGPAPQTVRALAGPSPGSSGVPGELDASDRAATIAEATIDLPEDPYVLRADPLRLAGPIEECFLASAVVHPRYDGERDWSAIVGLAQVRSPTVSTDLGGAATAALRQFRDYFFGGHLTTVSDVTLADHPVQGREGVLLTARVRYRISHLPSRYDSVRAVLVRSTDGSTVAAFSSVPSDAPAEVARLAADSLRSLRVG
jgi:hypothetical protein